MTFEAKTIFGARLEARLEPWMTEDLARLCDGFGQMFQKVLEVAEEEGSDGEAGYVPAWGKLLDPTRCPYKDLGYLGNYVGVEIPKIATEIEARQLIKEEAGLARGTLASLEAAIRRVLELGIITFPATSVKDTFKRGAEKPLSNGGKWETITGAANTGKITSGELWRQDVARPAESGALWNVEELTNPAVSLELPFSGDSTKSGLFVGIWCCLSKAAQSGYFLRFTGDGSEPLSMTVTLEKWVAGAKTILGVKVKQFLLGEDSIGISLRGEQLRGWRKHEGTWEELLKATDGTYTKGYTGFAMSGEAYGCRNFGYIETAALSKSFKIQERTATGGGAEAYHFNVLVSGGAATAALYEAINAVIPAGLWYSIIEVAGAWSAGTKQWKEVAAGKKWSAIMEGEYLREEPPNQWDPWRGHEHSDVG